jgi:hypothetical protein
MIFVLCAWDRPAAMMSKNAASRTTKLCRFIPKILPYAEEAGSADVGSITEIIERGSLSSGD